MTLLRWSAFLLGSLTVTLKVLLFWIFFLLLILAFIVQWLSLYWKFLIMLLSQFLLIFCQTQNGMPCFILNSCDGQDGLCDHLRNVPCDNIFKCSASAASEYCEWVQVGIDVYVYIISIRSSLTHLHSFQLLLQLP